MGFVSTLCSITSMLAPWALAVAWELKPSDRRTALAPDYKENRRKDGGGTDNDRQSQLLALTRIIKTLPVAQVYLSGCEADDIISHLRSSMKWSRVIIVSTDTDMYQLLDERTSMYSPATKCFVTSADVLAKTGVLAENHGIMKAICGDKSDNVHPAVPGFGPKRAAKLLNLAFARSSLDDIYTRCLEGSEKNGSLAAMLEAFNVVRKNWALVRLDVSILDAGQMHSCEQMFLNRPSTFDIVGLSRLILNEKLPLVAERLIGSLAPLCSTK